MKIIEAGNDRVVRSWASLLDEKTLEQAKMTARAEVVCAPVALMPDAHLGIGATVGSVVLTKQAVIPAAVGVDLGCGMVAHQLDLEAADLSPEVLKGILGRWRETIPAGVGQGHTKTSEDWEAFLKRFRYSEGVERLSLQKRAAEQFGTLGSGNHFAELSKDEEGRVWLVVHSGSRGVGNVLATTHIKRALESCLREGTALENRDLAFFREGTTWFDEYREDVTWAQAYAYHQREAMMARMVEGVEAEVGKVQTLSRINCHHNYLVPFGVGFWLTRKGAISAELAEGGIIPGSMGTATHIVGGKANPLSYNSAPHGAGRLLARGAAKRTLNVEEFRAAMGDRIWDDWSAEKLLDEAPLAYKPIEVVMADAEDLVESLYVLTQLVNYKGV